MIFQEDNDHQTAKFFKNRNLIVLAELQRGDREIQHLKEQIQQLSGLIRDREEELKEKTSNSSLRRYSQSCGENTHDINMLYENSIKYLFKTLFYMIWTDVGF